MTIRKRFLKSVLTTTTLAAALVGASQSASAAPAFDRTIGAAAVASTGVGLNGGNPLTAGSTLQYAAAHGLTLDVNALAIDINGQGLAGDPLILGGSISVGSMGNVAGGGAAAPASFNGAWNVNFTGTAGHANGAAVPANTYIGLGTIDFNGHAGATMTVSATGATFLGIDNTVGVGGNLVVTGAGNTFGQLGKTNALTSVQIAATGGLTTFNGGAPNAAQYMNVTGSGAVTVDHALTLTGGTLDPANAGNVLTTTAASGLLTLTGATNITTGNVSLLGTGANFKGALTHTAGNFTSTGVLTSAALTKVTAGNATLGAGTSNFNLGLTVTAGNLTTGSGLVTIAGGALTVTGAANGITLGGNVNSSENVSLGNAGLTGTGILAFTDTGKSFIVTPTANNTALGATATIKAMTGANETIINVNGNFASTFAGKVIAGDALGTATLTFTTGAGAGSKAIFTQDIGTATAKFGIVNLTGANDVVELCAEAKMYGTVVNLDNAGSTLRFNADSAVIGTITPAANSGVITVLGTSGGTTTHLDTKNALAALNFDATADTDSTFTIGATTALPLATIQGLNFKAAGGDVGGLVVDLSAVAANTANVGLTIGGNGVTVLNNNVAGTGSITFANNTNNNALTLTTGKALGSAANYLNSIDATDSNLTLAGGGFAIDLGTIKATQVTLNNVLLGIHNSSADANNATSFVVTAADSSITKGSIGNAAAKLNFATDNKLTLNDGVNFTGSITQSDGATAGTLVLGGTNIVSTSSIGTAANSLTKINITAIAGKTVSVLSSGATTADAYAPITFEAGSTATTVLDLGVNVRGTTVNNASVDNATGADGAGIVNLVAGDIDGSLGNVHTLAEVRIGTAGNKTTVGKVVAASTYKANATTFYADGTLALSDKVTTAVVLNNVTTKANHTGTMQFNQAVSTGTAVGATNFALKELAINNNSTFTVSHELHVDALTTNNNNTGTVDFKAASNAANTNIGTASNNFASVTTAGGVVTAGNIYSSAITVGAGSTLQALGFNTTNANGVVAAGTAEVLNGGNIGVVTGVGNVIVDGNATLGGNLGTSATAPLAAVSLNGAKGTLVNFQGSTIAATATTQNGTTLSLNNDATITGTYTGTNANIVTNGNRLTFGGNAVLGGATNVTYTYAADAPIITVASATVTVDVAARGDTVTFTRALGSALPVSGSTVAVFGTASNTPVVLGLADNVTNKTVVVNDSSKFFSTTYNTTTGLITYTGVATASTLVSPAGLTNSNQLDAANKIAAFINSPTRSNDTTFSAFVSQLEVMASTGQAAEAMARVTDASAPAAVADVSAGALAGLSHQAEGRMSSTTYAAAPGVAAGDAAEKFGVWAEVTGGTAEQKLRKNVSGFQARSFGAVVGVDTMLSDSSSLGVVAGNSLSTVKFKDTKSGDKLRADSWLFGAYGNYEFSNNYFVQANAAVAQTTAKSKSGRITPAGKVTAAGKYDMMSYVAEVRGGYKYQFENSVVAPTVGLRYNYFGDTSYTETGAGVQNLKVNTKSTSGLSALAGVKLGTTVDMNGSAIMPEVHMNLDYALSSSAPKARYNLDGSSVSLNYKGAKSSKFGYNFGASVMAQNDNVEYGVGYDANIADKYLGHQGTVKVKLKF